LTKFLLFDLLMKLSCLMRFVAYCAHIYINYDMIFITRTIYTYCM